jgi:hypothetical protein
MADIVMSSNILDALAPTELMLSNHLDFIDVSAIEGQLKPCLFIVMPLLTLLLDICAIYSFDDTDVAPKNISAHAWFQRGNLIAQHKHLAVSHKHPCGIQYLT